MFFQLKFYSTGNHSFRLFQHLETESQGQSTEDLQPLGRTGENINSVFGREYDVACVHMWHYNARVTCAASFMEI